MEISTEQLQAFLQNRCSAEEAAEIQAWLHGHPGALDQWLDENEWQQFEHANLLSRQQSARLLTLIQQQKRAKVVRLLPLRKWLRIAAVLLAVSGSIVLLRTAKQAQPAKQAMVTAAVATVVKDSLLQNHTGKQQLYSLADGSTISLSPGGSVHFETPFGKHNRLIRLQGTATFTVRQSQQQPFTVFTTGFSTTALGTAFHIKAEKGARNSSIQLLQGKVLVQNLVHHEQRAYLLPGQQCVFSNTSQILTTIQPETAAGNGDPAAGAVKTTADTGLGFVNMPLPVIMQKLASSYHVRIECAGTQLSKRRFTGHFSEKESLDSILETIAQLNDLSVTRITGGYQVTPLP